MPVAPRMTLAELLTDARASAGKTRRVIAIEIDATEQSVRNWERGIKLPRANQFSSICTAYGVTIDALTNAIAFSLRSQSEASV